MTRPNHPNPFYANRLQRRFAAIRAAGSLNSTASRCITIGNATLFHADCFDILPVLPPVGAVVTDPPYGIGFKYRTYDDGPERYEQLMTRLVPELVRVTENDPCFVWQSPLKADRRHDYFPDGWRIVAACKIYPATRVQ